MSAAVDYSWARPDPKALVAAGYTHVLRYLSTQPSKNLTPDERDALHAAGLSIGLVWETTSTRATEGWSAGYDDAVAANAQADALGFPVDKVIFYAVDEQVDPAQVRAYFQGALSIGRRPVGVYGDYDVIEYLVGGGLIVCGWQTGAWSGTGTGTGGSIDGRRVSRHACLFQRITPVLGGSCDHNDVLLDTKPWAAGPTPDPAPVEDIMTKAIRVPDDNPNLWWQVVRDGNGKLRRCAMTANDTIGLTFAGELDGTADLKRGVTGFGIDQGSIVDWLYALPTDPPAGVFEEITGEEMRIIAYLRDEILPKIGPPTPAH